MNLDVLGELPLAPGVSTGGDKGVPYVLAGDDSDGQGGKEWKKTMEGVASRVWASLQSSKAESHANN